MTLEPNQIICGDSLEIMRDIEDKSVDLILTDPPYDKFTHIGGRFTHKIKFGNVDFEPINIIPIIKDFLKICKKWVLIFCTIETLGIIQKEYIHNYVRGGIWDRIINSPQISGDRPAQACEGIAILHATRKKMKWNGGGKAGIWRFWTERGCKQHLTQKPIGLIRQLVSEFSNEGDLVLDPFAGSCTTAVACVNMNRNYICIEKEEKYCDIGRQRIKDAQMQQRLTFK